MSSWLTRWVLGDLLVHVFYGIVGGTFTGWVSAHVYYTYLRKTPAEGTSWFVRFPDDDDDETKEPWQS